MNMFYKTVSALCISLFLFSSCGEVKEGADKVAGEVTGERVLKQKKSIENKLKSLTEQNNKKNQEALDNLNK